MSDLGLGNLEVVRNFVLPESMQGADSDFDVVLTQIAQHVAAHFEAYTNRKFKRIEADAHYCPADRIQLWLPRAPVESVASVALQINVTDGYVTQTDVIYNQHLPIGWLYFGRELGGSYDVLRIIYTGGYWYQEDETLEETSDLMPAGATMIPADLRAAWLMQIQHLFALRDKLGIGITKAEPGAVSKLQDYDLLPSVEKILSAYHLYAG